MKMTVELEDSVFSELEAYAQRNGKSVNAVLAATISDKFAPKPEQQLPGLMSVFGTADREAVAEVQRIIDEEFSKVNPDDWK
jgi:hypothetical protein